MTNKLFPPLIYSIISGEPVVEGYTMNKPFLGHIPIIHNLDYKEWQQSKVAIKADGSIFEYLYINTHLWKWNDNLTIINIDFLADRIEVKEVETRCGDCNKYYQCVECNSPCGTEGHSTYTNKAFLMPEKELKAGVVHTTKYPYQNTNNEAHDRNLIDNMVKNELYTIEEIKSAISVFVAGEQTLDTDPFEVIINNLKK